MKPRIHRVELLLVLVSISVVDGRTLVFASLSLQDNDFEGTTPLYL